MDHEKRTLIIATLIADGTLPNHPTPADSVSGPEPCTAGCEAVGGKIAFQGFDAFLCHECFKIWRTQVK